MAQDEDAPLYDPKAWCTEENTAMRPGESQEEWTSRLLNTAVEHGDHEFVEHFQQRVAARLLGVGKVVPEA